jgi:glutamyl-Q tRNA(Asp) synthetase
MPPVFRFAPSPNGALHLGHALSALLNAEAAERTGGRMLVRVEDIDATRSREETIAANLADLDWLGAPYERPVLRQSGRMADYAAALERLRAMGLLYRSFASRGDIARAWDGAADPPRDPDGALLYPPELAARDRAAPADDPRPFAWRLDAAAAAEHVARDLDWVELGGGEPDRVPANWRAWGDVVLARKDTPASYHLAVVVDDAAQGVTHVVRGRDLFEATAVHRLLQTLLGLPAPAYLHHRLILGPDGRKLSKSRASESLAALRAGGATPADVRRLIGWDPDGDLAGLPVRR